MIVPMLVCMPVRQTITNTSSSASSGFHTCLMSCLVTCAIRAQQQHDKGHNSHGWLLHPGGGAAVLKMLPIKRQTHRDTDREAGTG